MKPEHLDLLSAYEANELDGEGRARAERLLREEPEAQEVIDRLRALRQIVDASTPSLMQATRRRVVDGVIRSAQRRRWARVGSGVACLAVAAALLLWLRPGPPTTTAHRTGSGGRLTLQLNRAAALFGENTEVEVLDGPTNTLILLRTGSARFVVDRVPGRSFMVETPAADAIVHGTEFDVQVTGDETEVRVVRGEVEVRNAAGNRRLWARETARARLGMSPRMVERREPVILHGPAEVEQR